MSASSNQQVVNVFPISSGAFGFSKNWFDAYASRLIQPAYLLMTLLLIIAVGIMVLKRFEDSNIEKKLWNLPVIITILGVWPFIVLGLKSLIDVFNTFLIHDVFQMEWNGFGFPSFDSIADILGWTRKAIVTLAPTLSYWIIYAFYIVFFFFFAVLGPFVLAKGILFDEIDAFLELTKELTLLFLWQTTLVILVAFILPDIVSGKPFGPIAGVSPSTYFLSIILSIMILFVPSITRKFANHLGSSFFPTFFKAGSIILGLGAVSKGLSAAGAPGVGMQIKKQSHRVLMGLEFRKRYQHQHELLDLKDRNYELEHELKEVREEDEMYHTRSNFSPEYDQEPNQEAEKRLRNKNRYLALSKRAKEELKRNAKEDE